MRIGTTAPVILETAESQNKLTWGAAGKCATRFFSRYPIYVYRKEGEIGGVSQVRYSTQVIPVWSTATKVALCLLTGFVFPIVMGITLAVYRYKNQFDLLMGPNSSSISAIWDRHLVEFWLTLRSPGQSEGGLMFHQQLGDAVQKHPEWLDKADKDAYDSCMKSFDPPRTSEVAESIRRILRNRHLQEHIFSTVDEIQCKRNLTDSGEPLYMVVNEIAYFKNVKRLTFYDKEKIQGFVDLRLMHNLESIDMGGSAILGIGDLILSKPVTIRGYSGFAERRVTPLQCRKAYEASLVNSQT